MISLVQYFVQLCLLRKGPQDLPASQALLTASGILLVLTAVVSDQVHDDLSGRLGFALAQVALLTIVVWVILSLARFPERIQQTLTAFYGSGTLIQLLIWPFRAMITGIENPQQAQEMTLPLLAILVFAVWSFVIMIHIYRNALDTTTGKAVLIGIITQIVIGLGMFNLFPDMQNQMTP